VELAEVHRSFIRMVERGTAPDHRSPPQKRCCGEGPSVRASYHRWNLTSGHAVGAKAQDEFLPPWQGAFDPSCLSSPHNAP